MYCRNCGKEINQNANSCPSCGFPPLIEKKFCQECGVGTSEKQVVCIKCGVPLINQVYQYQKDLIKRPVSFTILCIVILFFGVIFSIPLFISEREFYSNSPNISYSTFKFLGVVGLMMIASAVGLWLMRKIGAYLFILAFIILIIILALSIGTVRWNISPTSIIPLIIWGFIIYTLIKNWKLLK